MNRQPWIGRNSLRRFLSYLSPLLYIHLASTILTHLLLQLPNLLFNTVGPIDSVNNAVTFNWANESEDTVAGPSSSSSISALTTAFANLSTVLNTNKPNTMMRPHGLPGITAGNFNNDKDASLDALFRPADEEGQGFATPTNAYLRSPEYLLANCAEEEAEFAKIAAKCNLPASAEDDAARWFTFWNTGVAGNEVQDFRPGVLCWDGGFHLLAGMANDGEGEGMEMDIDAAVCPCGCGLAKEDVMPEVQDGGFGDIDTNETPIETLMPELAHGVQMHLEQFPFYA